MRLAARLVFLLHSSAVFCGGFVFHQPAFFGGVKRRDSSKTTVLYSAIVRNYDDF